MQRTGEFVKKPPPHKEDLMNFMALELVPGLGVYCGAKDIADVEFWGRLIRRQLTLAH
jgi:hypothetical protein